MVLRDRKSTRLNSSHLVISYAVFCLKKKQLHLRLQGSLVVSAISRDDGLPQGLDEHADVFVTVRVNNEHVHRSLLVFFFYNFGPPPEIYPFPLQAAFHT